LSILDTGYTLYKTTIIVLINPINISSYIN